MAATTNSPSIIGQLFEAAGVKRVVFVDDRFGITAERVEALANDLKIEDLSACEAFPKALFESDNEDIMRSGVAKLIGDAEVAGLQAMFDKMAAAQYAYKEGERDQKAASYFGSIVASHAEIILLSLKQWGQRKAELLQEGATTPTLFIFDDDFKLEGQSEIYGRTLIGETHAANRNYKFVYALLTHNALTDEAEETLQQEIAKDLPELSEYLLVIGKGRLSENEARFAGRMKHLLLYRLFRKLTSRLATETEGASKLAIDTVHKLSVQSFENIILGTSRAEGAWSPDTLVRVIGVYQQQHVKHNIRKDTELHQLVREMSPICDVRTSALNDDVTNDARRLQRDEIYLGSEQINAVQLPLTSGDIFADEKGEQYMLLAQPCDLMVRSTGYRGKEERDSRQMVPLAPLRKAESKYKDFALPAEQHELPLFADADRWSVRLNETYYLPVWLLDLCVLNADGRCYLVEGEEPSPLVIEPWRSRLAALLHRSRSVAMAVKLVTDEAIDRNDLLKSYCRIPLGSPFEIKLTDVANGNEKKWALEFGLKRTSRITESYATGVLIDYGAYLARLAHPHDLTRLKK